MRMRKSRFSIFLLLGLFHPFIRTCEGLIDLFQTLSVRFSRAHCFETQRHSYEKSKPFLGIEEWKHSPWPSCVLVSSIPVLCTLCTSSILNRPKCKNFEFLSNFVEANLVNQTRISTYVLQRPLWETNFIRPPLPISCC